MVVIIDGFNYLKHEFASSSERQQELLLSRLVAYQQKKARHVRLILVYDGGVLSYASHEATQGITVVHAGYKRSADEWIISYIETLQEAVIVVTRDRELGRLAKKALGKRADIMIIKPPVLTHAMHRIAEKQQYKKIKKQQSSPLRQLKPHDSDNNADQSLAGTLAQLYQDAGDCQKSDDYEEQCVTMLPQKRSKSERLQEKLLTFLE